MRKRTVTHLIKFICLIFIGILLAPALRADNNGVEFELIVRQKPELIDKYFEITRDTVQVLNSVRQYTLLVNMGLDIEIEAIDSQFITFNCHLITVGSNPYNYANRYRIEKNLPARIDNIPGKNNSVYQLLIAPRREVQIDTSCAYRPDIEGQYNMDPTAYFDLYFVKGSLGDYHWNSVKGYLEIEYRSFREALEINAPGKMNYYLCPCAATSLNWDKRFGYAIDPGRGNIYSIYTHEFVSTDALLANLLQLYRLWGYAPPFLAEGFAGYFDFMPYKIKKLKKAGKIPRLKTLLTTAGYHAADPITAEVTAASFMRYLADSYGIGRFRKMYDKSDDLTLLKNIETFYEMPLDTLEQRWLYYVDTFQLARTMFDHYAGRASALFQFDVQTEYLEQMLKYDETRFDSIDTRTKLATVYYQSGRYYDALDGFKELAALEPEKAITRQIVGNLYLVTGEYDKAWQMFDSAYALDSNITTSRLVQARVLAIRGDTTRAIELAEEFYPREQSTAGKIEYLLFLGRLYALPGSNYNLEQSKKYLTDATIWAADMIAKQPDDPAYKLRVGLAYLGLKQYYEAQPYLDLALFTEFRAYHLGRTLLALGNLYDALGKHDKAVEYYQACLENESSAHHQKLARQYIEQPFED